MPRLFLPYLPPPPCVRPFIKTSSETDESISDIIRAEMFLQTTWACLLQGWRMQRRTQVNYSERPTQICIPGSGPVKRICEGCYQERHTLPFAFCKFSPVLMDSQFDLFRQLRSGGVRAARPLPSARLFGSRKNVKRVPTDFDRDDLGLILAAQGYSAAKRTSFFVWEAVSQYLTDQGVRATRRLVKAAPASRLAFTYIRKDFLEGKTSYGWESGYRRFVASKIWLFGMEPEDCRVSSSVTDGGSSRMSASLYAREADGLMQRA